MKQITIVIMAFLIVACAPPQRQSQQYQQQSQPRQSDAQQQQKLYINAYNQAARNSDQCLAEMKKTEDAQLVYKEVMFENKNSANRLELMGSKKFITPKQSTALKNMLVQAQKCRDQRLDAIASIPYMPAVFKSYSTRMEITYSKLLSKSITIGEANQQRMETIQDTDTKMSEARQRLDKDMRERHDREVSIDIQRQNQVAQQRAADSAANAAAYQQQQQLFNNAQQLLRGDGGGQVNCYPTPGVPGSTYCR